MKKEKQIMNDKTVKKEKSPVSIILTIVAVLGILLISSRSLMLMIILLVAIPSIFIII